MTDQKTQDACPASRLNAGLSVTYGESAPFCTLPGKRVFARINGENLETWCTKILMVDKGKVVDAIY